MNATIVVRIIDSYQTEGGFIVHDLRMLEKIYHYLGIDPANSLDTRIYELEGITHFFQHGVVALARRMQISPDDYVLSPGEGSGAPSRLLAKMFGCKVTGIDINPEQINKAKELSLLHGIRDRVEYYQQDATGLSLDKNDFTKGFINETCVHWQDKKKAFKRIHAHLKKGALIGFNIWLKGDKGTLKQAYSSVPAFSPLYQEGIWFQEDLNTYKFLLERSGFKILLMFDCTDRVDFKIRARLKASKQWELYDRIMGSQAKESAINYYSGMLKTHYDFLRYGVIVALTV